MPDNKIKVGEPNESPAEPGVRYVPGGGFPHTEDESKVDPSREAGDRDYDVRYFAEKHGISIERAIDLINRFGNNREKLEKQPTNSAPKRLWTVG